MIKDEIYQYVSNHSTPDDSLLQELQRETFLKVLLPNMISSPLQGALLKLLSQLQGPKAILEIGTFTGYATLCLAAGLQPNGQLDTIDVNKELLVFHQKYFPQSKYGSLIKNYYGNALSIIPTLTTQYDLVFIDADKQNYSNYFDLVFDKVTSGGLIIADNVLWKEKVLQLNKDKDAISLDSFNKKVNDDPRVENLLLPIRDGLMIIKKK